MHAGKFGPRRFPAPPERASREDSRRPPWVPRSRAATSATSAERVTSHGGSRDGDNNQTMSMQSALDYSLGSQLSRRAQRRQSSNRVNRSGRVRSSLTILWLLQLLTCAMSLDVGLVAARLVSGLHQARFSDSGLVVVRRCVADADCANQEARVALAAVATRILDAPACRLCESSTDASTAAITPRRGMHEWGGMRLNIGDVLVARTGVLDALPSQNCLLMWVEACAVDDPTAFWVDTLHAARGTTPTSVTQWSKGTIFYPTG